MSLRLPNEHHPPTSRASVVKLIGLTVGLLIVCNLAVGPWLEKASPNRGYWLVSNKWRLLESARATKWLILGDSSCNQGFDPKVLFDMTGERGLNLCTIGNMTALEDVWMLSEYLARHGNPKRVVIIHAYDVWKRGLARALLSRIPRSSAVWESSTPSFSVGLLGTAKKLGARWLPLYTESASLAQLVKEPWKGREGFYLTTEGFMPFDEARPENVRVDTKRHIEFLSKNSPRVSTENQMALKVLSTIAENQGIEVFIVPSPLFEGMAKAPEYRRYYQGLLNEIRRYIKGDRVHLVEQQFVFEADVMGNADHLTTVGAKRFTKELVEFLGESKAH